MLVIVSESVELQSQKKFSRPSDYVTGKDLPILNDWLTAKLASQSLLNGQTLTRVEGM